MAIRAVVFDIGGVLESNPRTGWGKKWEQRLSLPEGQLEAKLGDVWRRGSLGTLSLPEVEQHVGEILQIDKTTVDALMGDVWHEYVGQPNHELITYFASLRPRYRTAILSNSFVGAREREEELYHFSDICDLIVYSHEEGMQKPDQRFFALVCERLGVQPHEVVFLDDVEGHVQAAQQFGIQAVVCRNAAQAIADVESILQAGAGQQPLAE